jgi:hypothetical protein
MTNANMAESEKFEAPKRSAGDIGYAIVRAGLSTVAGAPGAELLQLLFGAPLERRRDAWMKEVGQALQELEKNRGIRLEELQTNETFVTVVIQATQMALRNHQREKVQALRNAVINSAIGINIEEDLQLQFVRYVDELTPSHLALLNSLADQEQWLASVQTHEELYQRFVPQDLQDVSREEFKLLCADLSSRVLLRISPDVRDFEGVHQSTVLITRAPRHEGPMLMVTGIGRQFLAFVGQNS